MAKKYTELRFPMLMVLYGDPYERTQHDSEDYNHWLADRIFLLVPAQAKIAEFLTPFKEFPPREEVSSYSLNKVLNQK